MTAKKIIIPCCVLATFGALLWAKAEREPSTGEKMSKAATAFLKSLSDEQRKQATFAYNDKERLNWHYIPRKRKGLPLRDLEGE
ncbi:MAG: DUF3500 domain-containing protein, partial [Planctomycetes bacterium]|nr:DUF3500 domain-containing protein [Planctomycetota bacterium]